MSLRKVGASMLDPLTVAALEELISSYSALNSSDIAELSEEPSPLEFLRYVARNTPFVVRNAACSWKGFEKWDSAYLNNNMSGQLVNVAATPNGRADSPFFSLSHNELLLAKPFEKDFAFDWFLEYVMEQEKGSLRSNAEVLYAQTQNDNLRGEYNVIFSDVPKSIPFARIALQKEPEAVNLWIGNSKSVTAMHKDNYENIYVQMRGRKHFTLLPPSSFPCTNEKLLTPATYFHDGERLRLSIDEDSTPVPFPTWDPDSPASNNNEFSSLANPLRVTLQPGDMLYLPAMWYHKVAQSCIPGEEPVVIAVNYWYDMDYAGPQYPMTQFQRNVAPIQ